MKANNTNKTINLQPNNILIQIVPEFLKKQSDSISVPSQDIGYLVPVRLFLADHAKTSYNCVEDINTICNEFCGAFEVVSIYFNEKIRRDLLDELYNDNIHFDIFVRNQSGTEDDISGPKILKIYSDCYFYRQEFLLPENGLPVCTRYYFTNSNDPWPIQSQQIESLRPPNQYIYDYAVSKAVKNLQYPLNDICKAVTASYQITNASNEMTPSQYVDLVKKEFAREAVQ
jgi:hypothetical protein